MTATRLDTSAAEPLQSGTAGAAVAQPLLLALFAGWVALIAWSGMVAQPVGFLCRPCSSGW